jgi:hypothetical protein
LLNSEVELPVFNAGISSSAEGTEVKLGSAKAARENITKGATQSACLFVKWENEIIGAPF